jgi:hypothetical protein
VFRKQTIVLYYKAIAALKTSVVARKGDHSMLYSPSGEGAILSAGLIGSDTLEGLVGLIRESAQFLLAVAAVIAAIRSERRARSAEASAAVAHERATEAAREQLTFALKRAVRDAKSQGVLIHPRVNDSDPLPVPLKEGGPS